MKLFKFLILTNLIFSSSACVAGESGGGGNFMPGTKVTKEQAAAEVQEVKAHLVPVFNYLEMLLNLDVSFDPILVSARNKLFNGTTAVFDVLNKVQITSVENGPCYDEVHMPKDGSVFNTKANEFCLSIQNASEQLTTENLFPQLVGISVHELSHKLHANEKEAQALQKLIIDHLNTQSKNNYYSLLISLRDEAASLLRVTENFESSFNQGVSADPCNELDNLNEDAKTIQGQLVNVVGLGLSPLRKANWVDAVVLSTRVRMAKIYCSQTAGPGPDVVNTRKISIQELFQGGGPIYSEYNSPITMVGYKDNDGLKVAIRELKQSAEALKLALAIENPGLVTIKKIEGNTSDLSEVASDTCLITRPGGKLENNVQASTANMIRWQGALYGVQTFYKEGKTGDNYLIHDLKVTATMSKADLLKSSVGTAWEVMSTKDDAGQWTQLEFIKMVFPNQKEGYKVQSWQFKLGDKVDFFDQDSGIKIQCNIPKADQNP